jgi:hypothetical protein
MIIPLIPHAPDEAGFAIGLDRFSDNDRYVGWIDRGGECWGLWSTRINRRSPTAMPKSNRFTELPIWRSKDYCGRELDELAFIIVAISSDWALNV